MNNKILTVFECDFDGEELGRYYQNLNMIVIKDINDKKTLIHEITHALHYQNNNKLLNYLKELRLDYNKSFNRFRKCQAIRENTNIKLIMQYYEPSEWVGEVIAYHMQNLPEETLRALDIKEYNRALNGSLPYWTESGELIIFGKVMDKQDINSLLDFIRRY